jgi:DNA polymerase III epsilon subunit-like protein
MATGNSRILSIDVECVATSHTHEDRSPCSVAVVDDQCQIIFSSLIKPIEKVVSDLYPFTGLRMKDLEQAPTLEEILQKVKSYLFQRKFYQNLDLSSIRFENNHRWSTAKK